MLDYFIMNKSEFCKDTVVRTYMNTVFMDLMGGTWRDLLCDSYKDAV